MPPSRFSLNTSTRLLSQIARFFFVVDRVVDRGKHQPVFRTSPLVPKHARCTRPAGLCGGRLGPECAGHRGLGEQSRLQRASGVSTFIHCVQTIDYFNTSISPSISKNPRLTSNNQHRSSLYLSLVFLGECEHLPCQPPVLYCPPSSLCTRFARAHAIATTVWRRAPLNHYVLPCLLGKNLTITRLRAHWPRSRRPTPPLRRRSKVPRRMLGPVATHRVETGRGLWNVRHTR